MLRSTVVGGRKFVAVGSIIALLLAGATLILVPPTLRTPLSQAFLPHIYCYLQDKRLIALHLGSDAAIWLSYVAIALTLVYLVRRTRREIPYSWMFLAFGTFIIACGFTHFMEMVVLWKPLYWLAGDVKLVTALASVVTAMALPPLVPQIHDMIRSAHLSEERRFQLEHANHELQHLSARVLGAQDGERRRIARELHDGVVPYLSAIAMSLDTALAEPARTEALEKSLRNCRNLLDRSISEIRTMSHLLHPPLLEEIGLVSAVPWYVEGFRERSRLQVELEMPREFSRLPQEVEIVLFRVLQEALTNIHRHSGSKVASIRFEADADKVSMLVRDRGTGFQGNVSHTMRTGVGVASMRERVRELRGDFEIESTSQGTAVKVVIPLKEQNLAAAQAQAVSNG
jgi:signal transduction histidine kinase